jgi:hypothetical protein
MTVFQKIVKASELPPEWAKSFPDQDAKLRIEIREVDEELESAKSVGDVMDIISRRAQERGLTPELLQEILNER